MERPGRIEAKTLIIGLQSDLLFPLSDQQFLADHIPGAQLTVIDSDYGHDAFLLEAAAIANAIKAFLQPAPLSVRTGNA